MTGSRTTRTLQAEATPSAIYDRDTVIVRGESRLRDAFARRAVSSRYSWFDVAHLYAMQEIERRVLEHLRAHGFETLAAVDILDVGCGTGVWLREFIKWGANPARLQGIDLLEDRVAEARRLSPPAVRFDCGSAARLAYSDASFDIVLQSLVFTSILERDVRALVAAEMLRVVRPGGVVLWYDAHVSNPANADFRGVRRCELQRLFPGCDIDTRRVTVAAPLARAIAPHSAVVYRLLQMVPFLTTHYLAVIRPQ